METDNETWNYCYYTSTFPTLFEQLYKKGYFLSEKQHINRILARQKIQMNIKSKVNIVSG